MRGIASGEVRVADAGGEGQDSRETSDGRAGQPVRVENAGRNADSLRAELRRAMTEHWYDDRYRTVPDFQRTRRILDDYPALAGHKRTIGALKAALSANH